MTEVREGSEFMKCGMAYSGGMGAKNFGHVPKGGGKKFWTRCKGGPKISNLTWNFFRCVETTYMCF